jgi:transcriptional regulator with XRE-family HTH domain
MPDSAQLGSRLRGMRAAAGRTVASVAADAGLSVPYIANLENGRGNPTLAALDRLATALGTSLEISFAPADEPAPTAAAGSAGDGMPASLVRLGRSRRFRRDAALIAEAAGADPADLSVQLISVLAGLARTLGTDPGEAGWHRVLDALLLIALYPSTKQHGMPSDAALTASDGIPC